MKQCLLLVRRKQKQAWMFAGGLALAGVAAWLRWRYAQTVHPHVDEYITLWAAERTRQLGLPLLPSGVIYPRGLPMSYLIAAAGSTGGVTLSLGRLLNVVFGAASVALCLAAGWRSWRFSVGILAALGLALAPETIEWSSRARFYAPTQFFALLAVWAAYLIVRWDDEPSNPASGVFARRLLPSFAARNLLFAAALISGLFSQEVMVFLYPPLGVAMAWWRGWRFLLRPAVLAAHLACLLAICARLVVDLLGQPGQLATFQSTRPYISLALDLPGAWAVYGPLLLGPERQLWFFGAGLAFFSVGVLLAAKRGAVRRLPVTHQATLFFALPTLFMLFILLTVGGVEWREARFFMILQPMWLLLGAAGIIDLLYGALRMRWMPALATAVIGLLVIALNWLPVERLLADHGSGLGVALAYVAENRQPGDLVLTSQPSACAFVVKNCNYYAREDGYAPYVIAHGDRVVDRYAGLPLLRSPEQLAALLRAEPVVWFVIDRESLMSSRYSADFLRLVVEQFKLPFAEEDGLALRATGWQEQPPPVAGSTLDPHATYGPLRLSAWERAAAAPGRPLAVTLFWRTTQRLREQISTSVQIVSAAGALMAQDDSAIAHGLVSLQPDDDATLPDPKRLSLPADLPPGRYRVDTLAYAVATTAPLAEQPVVIDWFWIGAAPPPPEMQVGAEWVNGLRLAGYHKLPDQLQPGVQWTINLQWTTTQPIPQAYTAFAHLLGPNGQVVAQSDRQPEGGFYPTWAWDIGEPIADPFQLATPASISPGVYRLLVGWYEPSSGERVRLPDGTDALELAQWAVK
jgi:hypothetical protein